MRIEDWLEFSEVSSPVVRPRWQRILLGTWRVLGVALGIVWTLMLLWSGLGLENSSTW